MLKNKILIAQLQTMYPQVKFLFMGIVALTLVVINTLWNKADNITIIIWASSSALLIIIRSFMLVYSANNLSLNNVRVHALIFAIGSLISGCIWSLSSFIFLDLTDSFTIILIVTLLMGSTAGALVTLSAYLPAFYGYSVTVLIPLSLLLINQPNDEIAHIGYLVSIYLIALLGYSHAVNRNLKQFISMRFVNENLLEDLTKQRDLAEQANIEKSRYLAATSHDLRQPLHALQLYLGNFERHNNTPSQQLLINKSINAGNTLNSLLSALMDASQLDSGEVELNMQTVELAALIEDISQEFQTQAEQQNIVFSTCVIPVNVLTDPLLLSRCIRNLITNAFAHADASNITIRTALYDQDQVKIIIADDGVGISHNEKDQIFSEFYQLNNPERDRNKGLGLGLAIVKKLSTLLGHKIQLNSTEDQGCEFSLHLTTTDILPVQIGENIEDIDISGLFIVMVDDDPDICDAISISLKNWGCESIVCQSTATLLEEFNRLNYSAPDIIIADYRLRDNKTGVETIQKIRSLFNREIPAILISGDNAYAVMEESIRLNSHYQQKPISLARLKHTLAKIVEK